MIIKRAVSSHHRRSEPCQVHNEIRADWLVQDELTRVQLCALPACLLKGQLDNKIKKRNISILYQELDIQFDPLY